MRWDDKADRPGVGRPADKPESPTLPAGWSLTEANRLQRSLRIRSQDIRMFLLVAARGDKTERQAEVREMDQMQGASDRLCVAIADRMREMNRRRREQRDQGQA